ncbi:RluA family pseudouridine synthase [uncultured Finegoldia sp.]|uniref:RluA family pseudouridine synthase n=1 Tax=uncultured Finegoldia sp. TaxID=328009 RepID=UPI0025ECCAE3|nr:RluA family pseudouridine synthase [uncultured Finegoldia sp.]MDU1833212.1 RluA family pseudouridine synthase [Finegoldia magna]
MIYEFLIDDSNQNTRLDVFLANEMELSRSEIQKFIEDKKVLVNDKAQKKNYKLNSNDKIKFDYEKEDKTIRAQKHDLDVVYEDEYLAVINKDKNIIVHPTETIYSDTLVNYLMYNFDNLSDVDGDYRRGIVHRLDKDTTGLIIIAKDNDTHLKLKEIIKNHEITKTYLCIVHGKIDESGTIEKHMARNPKDRKKMMISDEGKLSISYYERLDYNEDYSLVKVQIKTGRTHQIRVHMNYIHHPILGDKLYGLKKEKILLNSQVLHAYNLQFIHPQTYEKINVIGKLKPDFITALNKTKLDYTKIPSKL